MKRILLLVVAAFASVSLFLLTSASANTDFFAAAYPYLLALNGVIALGLIALVALQLKSLWQEYQAGKFGSRLKYRMMMMFALIAVVPGILVYAVSMQFLVRSIDSWFDVRVDRALEGGVVLGQKALDFLVMQAQTQAHKIATELSEQGHIASSTLWLDQKRELSGATSLTLLSANGHLLTTVSDDLLGLVPSLPTPSELRQARRSRDYHVIESGIDHQLQILIIISIPPNSLLYEPRYLQLIQKIPSSLSQHIEVVQEAHRDYQQLVLGRIGLSRIYSLTLTLTLLLALLGAVAVAFMMSRKLAAPLLILSEGTQAVAQGDFSPRQALPAKDELGILTQSFNKMTQQLEEARDQTEKSRHAVEASRIYLESVLAYLSTGVLAFDANGHLRAANRGATDILQDPLKGFEEFPLAAWPKTHSRFRDAILKGFETHKVDWQSQLELTRPDREPQTLRIHGARLPQSSGGGLVVVFDDISNLLTAQRTAAWAEVARRLAHEIKNPLTPIQLSAERLAYKLKDQLDEKGQATLLRSTDTIVSQVDAMKNLVDALRGYAILPSLNLIALDLNALIGDVLHLYENSSVPIEQHFQANLPLIRADATQIRQVVHNLLLNAEDAVADIKNAKVLLHTGVDNDMVFFTVHDNGTGFSQELLARAFEPYFTTKSRGTGLGLAIVKKIVDEHGGRIQLANMAPSGAQVKIWLQQAAS